MPFSFETAFASAIVSVKVRSPTDQTARISPPACACVTSTLLLPAYLPPNR